MVPSCNIVPGMNLTILVGSIKSHQKLQTLSRTDSLRLYNQITGLVGRVFANGPGELSSIPDTKDSKNST